MIREATPADYPSFAALFPELGVDDATPTLERWTAELVRDTLVSERAGRVDGYVTFYTLHDAAHVRNLVVAPGARGTGVGRELMRAAAGVLRARGAGQWHLNVKRDNAPAIRLYERLGMRVEHESAVIRLPWTLVDALPAEPAVVLPVAPDDDAEIERELGLLAGRIAMGRVRPGRVLFQLRDAGCAPVGYATFDPALGASPFRVARPELAATLIAALRPHARLAHLQIVAEDAPPLIDLLARAGAELRLQLLHYRGAL